MASEPPAGMFDALKGHKYMSLTTFRRGGVPVVTPVWFAEQNGRLYVTTSSTSGKVKRIRRDPIVTVAPCTSNGRLLGHAVPGKARILPPEEQSLAEQALSRKYRLEKGLMRVLRVVLRRKAEGENTFLEIRPV